jgi:hypothetical protein
MNVEVDFEQMGIEKGGKFKFDSRKFFYSQKLGENGGRFEFFKPEFSNLLNEAIKKQVPGKSEAKTTEESAAIYGQAVIGIIDQFRNKVCSQCPLGNTESCKKVEMVFSSTREYYGHPWAAIDKNPEESLKQFKSRVKNNKKC